MIYLRETLETELEEIVALEGQDDIREFITPHTLEEHQEDFHDDEVMYLTIVHEGAFVGFIILVHHSDNESIECLRIAIGVRGKGIGQQALTLMEAYCKARFNAKRIWLDVFSFNQRAIHVYSKLGYRQFNTGVYQGKQLHYMEKAV